MWRRIIETAGGRAGRAGGALGPHATDAELIAAVGRGDIAAFERVYRRHFSAVAAFASRITGRVESGADVASEVLTAVWRQAASFEGRSKPSTWIFGIAYRIALKARARDASGRGHVELDEDMPAPVGAFDEVETVFLRAQLCRALATLSPEHRAVVELTYVQGYSCAEVAEIVGCPAGTVKTRMMHARARLRTALIGPAGPTRDDADDD